MRVTMVNRADAFTALGGDTVQMVETAAALRRLGVEVVECAGAPSAEQIAAADLVHLFNLQTPQFTLDRARQAAAVGKPIAVSTIYWDFAADQLLCRSSKWRGLSRLIGHRPARWIAQVRTDLANRDGRSAQAQILRLAAACLPNSSAEVVHLQRLERRLPPVFCVPNAVDGERFHTRRGLPLPSKIEERAIGSMLYVLVAARIEPDKNQLEFCRAVAPLGHSIVLAGNAPDEAYRRACEEEGAHWIGPLEGDELAAAYAHARVHALPSFRETPGLSSLEAAACGAAIVTTQVGSAREYFGSDAEYCDPADPTSMRMAVKRAWELGPPAGLAERIRAHYSWDKAAEATLAAYRAVLDAKSSSGS